MRHGYRARVDVRSQVERMVYWSGEYEPELRTILKRLTADLPDDAVIFDIGANVGLVTLSLATLANGRIHAVEAFPPNVKRLKENVALNGLQNRIAVWHFAVGKTEGRIQIIVDDESTAGTGNAYTADPSANRLGRVSFEVPLLSLDAWSREQNESRCDFIKIDIEGGEFDFLLGAKELIARNTPTIVMELNYHRMRKTGWTLSDLDALTRPWGYTLYRFRHGKFEPLIEGARRTENAVLIHSDKAASIR